MASLLDARGAPARKTTRADGPRKHPLRVNGATLSVGTQHLRSVQVCRRGEIERKFNEIVAFAEDRALSWTLGAGEGAAQRSVHTGTPLTRAVDAHFSPSRRTGGRNRSNTLTLEDFERLIGQREGETLEFNADACFLRPRQAGHGLLQYPPAARSFSAWRMKLDNWSGWLTRKGSRAGSSTFSGRAAPWM